MESEYIGVQRTFARRRVIAAVSLLAVLGLVGAFVVLGQTGSTNNREVYNDHMGKIYKKWKDDFGLNYGGAEDKYRLAIFQENYVQIHRHNMQPNNSYWLGLTPFTALTLEEFKTLYLGFNAPLEAEESKESRVDDIAMDIPDAIDWTAKGKVTDVKNQNACGSCWAFSTTGSVEAALAIKNGKLVSLSEQELVDCSRKYGNMGCNGGLMTSGFKYIIDHQIGTEADYPYKGVDGTCRAKNDKDRYKIKEFKEVPALSKDSLKQVLANQPVSVAIQADSFAFQHYSKGVLNDKGCGENLNHGVLAVGYGTEGGLQFYRVKNSWGTSWGDQGYIKLAIVDGAGICGIHKMSSYPIA